MAARTIATKLDKDLLPLGFVRARSTWNRAADPFIDVVDIQRSKSGDMITLNAGVFHRSLYERCWGSEAPAFVKEPFCVVRARIGQLHDGAGSWWSLDSPTLEQELIGSLRTYVLPFLQSMHSIDAMERFLASEEVEKKNYPPPILYLALSRAELGDKPAACEMLALLRSKTTAAWKARVDDVIKRMGCD